jgi:hypothetical protein
VRAPSRQRYDNQLHIQRYCDLRKARARAVPNLLKLDARQQEQRLRLFTRFGLHQLLYINEVLHIWPLGDSKPA